MKKRIFSIFLCVLIIFSVFLSVPIKTQAFMPLLFVNDQVIMASVLSAMGYNVNQEGFEEFCEYAYDSLSMSQKAMMAEKALAVAYIGNGIGEITFSKSEWNGLIDWYNLNSNWMNSTISYGVSIPSNINDYVWSGTINIRPAMQTIYNSATNDRIITYNQAGTNYYQNFECFIGDFKLKLDSSGTVSLLAETGSSITHYSYSGTTLYTDTIGNFTGTLKLVLYSGVFNLLNSSNQPIGTMSTGTSTLLQQMSLFNPLTHPLIPSVWDDYKLHVPVAEVPQTGIDEGIEMPSSSAEHPISLDMVLDWYGSLQNYFDAGNVIFLGDGTTLSGTNEYTRATGTDVLPDVTTGTDVPADVGLIGNIVSRIKAILDAILNGIQFIISWLTGTADFTIAQPIQPFIEQFINKMPIHGFDNSMAAFKNLQVGYGSPPQIKINIHALADTAQGIGSFSNTLPNQDHLIIDFSVLQDTRIKFSNMTLIELIRMLFTASMVFITYRHVAAKIIPDKVISGGA